MKRTDKEIKQSILVALGVYDDTDNHFESLRSGFTAPMLLVKSEMTTIISLETSTGINLKGDTKDKENKFYLLGQSLFHIASGARGYAAAPAVNDLQLKTKVDYTLPKILKIPYADMEAFSQGIIDAVTPVITHLAPYGVLPANLTDTSDKRDAFIAIQKQPQINIDKRKSLNAEIHPHILKAEQILTDSCDPIADTLFADHHDLYELWYNARKINHFPHGTTVVEGYVFRADGVTPIYNATIDFPEQRITTKTYLDGSYRVIKFPHGITTPTASFEGSSQRSEPFEVKQGHTVKHNFILGL